MSIIIMERLASYQMQYGWVKDQITPFSAATKQSTTFYKYYFHHIQNWFRISRDYSFGKIYIPLPLFWIGSIEHNNPK